MRPFLFALAVTAGLGTFSVPAAAAPVVGASGLAATTPASAESGTEVGGYPSSVLALALFLQQFQRDLLVGAEGGLRYMAAPHDAADFSSFDA